MSHIANEIRAHVTNPHRAAILIALRTSAPPVYAARRDQSEREVRVAQVATICIAGEYLLPSTPAGAAAAALVGEMAAEAAHLDEAESIHEIVGRIRAVYVSAGIGQDQIEDALVAIEAGQVSPAWEVAPPVPPRRRGFSG